MGSSPPVTDFASIGSDFLGPVSPGWVLELAGDLYNRVSVEHDWLKCHPMEYPDDADICKGAHSWLVLGCV